MAKTGAHLQRQRAARGETPAIQVVGTGFDDVRQPVLRDVARKVRAYWTNALGDAVDDEEVDRTLGWLVAAIDTAVSDGKLPDRGGPATTVLGRHLVDLIRSGLLEAWTNQSKPPEPALVLRMMRAAEATREAIEPDWSGYFSSRLSGPDGLDLVVEVAHDLRSPVTSIIFLADTLGRGQSGEVNELQKRQLRLIYSAALGLSSMTSDVIELARGGDQLVEREVSPFSVAEILESVTDMVRPIAEEKGLFIKFETTPTDHRLGRPLALSRVLLNLTTNALKFTDEGMVEITARSRGLTKIEFSVRDTGHGISEEAQANLYQPFRRTRGRAGRSGFYFSGTGLGLAMCRKLVEAMNSKLEFETRQGWGTRFFFELEMPVATHL